MEANSTARRNMKAIQILLSLLYICSLTNAQEKTANQNARQSSIFFSKIVPRVYFGLFSSALETPVQIRGLLYVSMTTWNAWSKYHPTAVDIFGRSRFRRPRREHTFKNKDVAIMFALFRVYEASTNTFGGTLGIPEFRKIVREEGLDPDDHSMNMSTPVGIGNRMGLDTASLIRLDGWNADGQLTATADNYRLPFQDYTGYEPKNSPWRIQFPLKWQPALETDGRGFFFRQEFVTPQAGSGISFLMTPGQVAKKKLKSPYRSIVARTGHEHPEDLHKLKAQAKSTFQVSAQLTETQRLYAEYFDNKAFSFKTPVNPFGVLSIGGAIRFTILGNELDWDLDEDVIYGLGSNIVTFEAVVLAWKEKRRFDAARPTGQTMEYLFGNETFRVWGGPGKSSTEISAGEWMPYLRTMPHSEYPSASAAICTSFIEHARENANGREKFPFSVVIPKGSSAFYPGRVPERDTTLSINSLREWDELCAKSRIWAGVHFEPSVRAGRALGRGLGKRTQNFVQGLLNGKIQNNWLEWLPKDVDKFWEK